MKQRDADVAIVTLVGYRNYGNRLQNYAVQEILKKYGFIPETLVIKKSLKAGFRNLYFKLKALTSSTDAKRYVKFLDFTKKHIRERVLYSDELGFLKKSSENYRYAIVGSDQVWNPLIRLNERDYFFLRFLEKEKRVCISPSFGVTEIPEENIDDFFDGLNGFDKLCSREQAGVEIIKKITQRDAELLIDPTLALTRKEWAVLFEDIYFNRKPYLLVAYLGKIERSYRDIILKTADDYNLEIIDIFNNNAFGIEEVLGLLANASLVCTDSFHFSAFSINFNVPFYAFKRSGDGETKKMFSRLQSLTDMFGLSERIYDSSRAKLELNCDFSEANKILEFERHKFYNYFEQIFYKRIV